MLSWRHNSVFNSFHKMIQKLRRLLHLETTEEALRDFAGIIAQGEVLKSEIDTMAREYLGSRGELDQWAATEKEPDVQELIKAQQDGLTSRYLAFLSDKQQEHFQLEARKQFYTAKYPDFEKALSDLKKNDFIEHILTSYRTEALSLEESNTLIKAVTKSKVQYADNIVFNQKGELLIVQRQPLGGEKEGANLWVLPGGHVKMGEKFDVAAQRELLEESGYTAEDVYHVGDYDDDMVHIEYYCSMVDTDEQSPTVDASETRATEFIHIKDLYKYPTMHDIWGKVYEILGIEEHVVKIKKAIAEGIVKNERAELVVDDRINALIKGCGGSGVKAKFKKVMDKWKAGKLKSGESDETVTSQKQAIAIALSETGQSKEQKEKAIEPVIEKAQKSELIYHDKKTAPAGVKAQFGVVKLKPGAKEALPKVHKMHIRTEADGVNVYLVDGTFVRDKIYDDFTEGGNDAAYPDFVPVNEIWIDGNMCLKDIEATIVHETTERTAMLTDDQSYDKDHDKANVAEGKFRAGDKDLDDKAQHDPLPGRFGGLSL